MSNAVADYDFFLPRERIAQVAVEPRDAARLLVLDRTREGTEHRHVRDLPSMLRAGDVIVVNDTRVIPARIIARKPSGGRVEVLLLEQLAAARWRALVGASRAPRAGDTLFLPNGFQARVVDPPGEGGEALVDLEGPGPLASLLEEHGRLPLPPYIKRDDDDPRHTVDRVRYQTVFANAPGAIAAPTAGLHFTPALLRAIEERGVAVATITLHVGEGTFRTPEADEVRHIRLHDERYEVPEATVLAIERARAHGGRVVAVGTTVVRSLESRPEDAPGVPRAGGGSTHLFIAPGFGFRYVDALLTNFHLPRSTLLMLVAAFAGRERVLAAYREAVALEYRFFSYGDAMLIL